MTTKANKTTSPTITVDPLIEQTLHEAYTSSMRQTEEYALGRIEERQDQARGEFKAALSTMHAAAEAFFRVVKEKYKDVEIIQHRIGLDNGTDTPAVLMVLSEKNADSLPSIRALARQLEMFAWKEFSCPGYLWTRTDGALIQSLVERDFPFHRIKV